MVDHYSRSTLASVSNCFSLHPYHVDHGIRADATYLLKAVQGFQSKGFPIYSISIQVSHIVEPYSRSDTDSHAERTAKQ